MLLLFFIGRTILVETITIHSMFGTEPTQFGSKY